MRALCIIVLLGALTHSLEHDFKMGKPELLKPQSHLLDLNAADPRNLTNSDPCAEKSDKGACQSVQDCEWIDATTTCQKVDHHAEHCEAKTKAECDAEAICTWEGDANAENDATGSCEHTLPANDSCSEHGTEALCDGEKECDWKDDTNKCVHSCSDHNQADCSSHHGKCIWESNECELRCPSDEPEPLCVATAGCTWKVTSTANPSTANPHEGTCELTCFGKKKDACDLLSFEGCVWDNGFCHHKCTENHTESACNAVDAGFCTWSDHTETCELSKCPTSTDTAVTSSCRCGTSQMSPICDRNATYCYPDDEFECHEHPSTDTSGNAATTTDGTGGDPPTQKPSPTPVTHESSPNPVTSDRRNLQRRECTSYEDKGDCNSLGNIHGCFWNTTNDKCQKCSSIEVEEDCIGTDAEENCLWNEEFGRCQLDCSALDTRKDCHHVHGCVWEDKKCSNCADYETAVCKDHSDYCEVVDEMCEARCSNFPQKDNCLDFGCNWNGKKCGHLDARHCKGNDDKRSCQEAACGWDGTHCKACADFDDVNSCPKEEDLGCKVECSVSPNGTETCPDDAPEGATPVCKPDCGKIDSKHFCRKKKGCHLKGDTCTNDTAHTDKSCEKIDREPDCSYGCKWRKEHDDKDDDEKPCVIDCSTIGSSGACESKLRCDWNGEDDVCEEASDFGKNGLPKPDINREESAKTFDEATETATTEIETMTSEKAGQIESNVYHTQQELHKMYEKAVLDISEAAMNTLNTAAHHLDTKMKQAIQLASDSLEAEDKPATSASASSDSADTTATTETAGDSGRNLATTTSTTETADDSGRNLTASTTCSATTEDTCTDAACAWFEGHCHLKDCSAADKQVCESNPPSAWCTWVVEKVGEPGKCIQANCELLHADQPCQASKHFCTWDTANLKCKAIPLDQRKDDWEKAHKDYQKKIAVEANAKIQEAKHLLQNETKAIVTEVASQVAAVHKEVGADLKQTQTEVKEAEEHAQSAVQHMADSTGCSKFTEETDCTANSDCQWVNDACQAKTAATTTGERALDASATTTTGDSEVSKGENLEASSTDEALEASTQDRN